MIIWWLLLALLSVSLLYGTISVYSVLTRLSERVWIDVDPGCIPWSELPKLAILLPFYKETLHDVKATFRSIASQRYPRDKLRVVVILEKDDEATARVVEECRGIVEDAGLKLEIVVNQGERKSKARALNEALARLRGWAEAIAVYDAGDTVLDELHLAKAATLMRRGYVVIGSKVYRVGRNVIGRLSYIDTLLWYNVALPGLTKLVGYPLVSGEGLVVSTSFLEVIGGFPEKLTEDSYITMLVARYRARAALLNVVVYEGAPANVISFIKQRLRWYRGYLECLADLLIKHGKEMRPVDAARLVLAYAEPLALIATMGAVILVALSPWIAVPQPIHAAALVITAMTLCAPLYVVIDIGLRDRVLLLAPLYWAAQGAIVLVSLAVPRIPWLRTTRTESDLVASMTT